MGKTAAEWATLLLVDDRQQVSKTANDLADFLHSTSDIKLVCTLMQHPDDGVRSEVAWAMQEARSEKLLQPILQGLNDRAPRVRYWCTKSLRAFPAEHRVKAIVHLFIVLQDDIDYVRFAAADAILVLSDDFPVAITADPIAIDITGEKAGKVLQTQKHLQLGYEKLATGCVAHQDDEVSDWPSQIGFNVGIKMRWKEIALLTNRCLQTFLPDARSVLIQHVGRIVTDVVKDFSSLTSDSEPSVREHSWKVLSLLTFWVARWRQKVANAACDNDSYVRKASFKAIEDEMVDSDVFRAVADACRELGDANDSQAALLAMQSMVADAAKVASIDNSVLHLLVQAIDNPKVSKCNQKIALSVLQSYAEIFQQRQNATRPENTPSPNHRDGKGDITAL